MKHWLPLLLLFGCSEPLPVSEPPEEPQETPQNPEPVLAPTPPEPEPEALELGEELPCGRKKPGVSLRWTVQEKLPEDDWLDHHIIQPVDWVFADLTGDGEPEYLANVEKDFKCSQLYLKGAGGPRSVQSSWGCSENADRRGVFVFLGCYDSDRDGRLEVLIEDGPMNRRTKRLLEWDGASFTSP